MNVEIIAADVTHIASCVDILHNSDIGRVYFEDSAKAATLLSNAMLSKCLYVAIDADCRCIGFVYYIPNGVFGSYPYLHIVAVKEDFRNLGIGRQLISFFEEHAPSYPSTKCFLTVDDFNQHAQMLYERLGYTCVGVLPDFYKKGINCHLMMKEINK